MTMEVMPLKQSLPVKFIIIVYFVHNNGASFVQILVRGKLVGSRAGNIHFLYSSDKHGSENVSAKKI